MAINLYPYQENLINKTRESLKSGHRSPLIVAPCGSGKTVMFSYFTQAATSKGKRTLVLAHRDELLEQISETLKQFDVKHGFIAAGRFYSALPLVHVGSIFSVARRLDRIPKPDIIIIDECHHSAASTYKKTFNAFPKAWKIGVTASPIRLSGESLGEIFDDLILGPTIKELTDLGFLSPYKIFAPSTISTEGIHITGGDFNKKELAIVSDKPTITGSAVDHYRRLAHNKRAICFCVSIEHAKHVAAEFRAAGYQSCSIDGKMSREVRSSVVKDFREGKIHVLTSIDVVSEGFNLPAIEVAIMLRPTASLGCWIQQSGRALRLYPGKEYAIILDHSGNCHKLGMPDEDHTWTLEGRQNAKKTSAPTLSLRTCPSCFAAMRAGVEVCAFCGFKFPIETREVAQVEGQLQEIDRQAVWRQRMQEQGHGKTLQDLIELGKRRGYKSPLFWAQHVMAARLKKQGVVQ